VTRPPTRLATGNLGSPNVCAPLYHGWLRRQPRWHRGV